MEWLTGILGSIGGGLLEFVLPALGAAIAGIASKWLIDKARQSGIELTEAQERYVRERMRAIVRAVEELARREPTMTSEEKRAVGIARATDEFPSLSAERIEMLLDETLPDERPKLELQTKARPRTPADLGRP